MDTMTTMDFATDALRWEALTRRDRAAEGAFYVGVRTTGIYCRPTCASRLPRRENVRFFATPGEAERAGFRPCKRCRPQLPTTSDADSDAVTRACRLIEAADTPPRLQALADAVGLSRHHFHRLFKRTVGVTPKEYTMMVRQGRLQASLRENASVTRAIYDAGFGSTSRVYESASGTLGMTPGSYRNGAAGLDIRFAVARSSLGWLLVAATERGICAIELDESAESLTDCLRRRFPLARLVEDDPTFADWVARVTATVEAPGNGVDLPLDVRGTAFQRSVWRALQAIPVGTTMSYGEVARRLGQPTAARAVAAACAANSLAVAIPCHRVVRGDGDLGGYRWGTDRKRTLLDREAAATHPDPSPVQGA
jgi:AraC family transcriptional regulator of adaptative response/methylated-DNA-[protein]-cysteine methyltransferase